MTFITLPGYFTEEQADEIVEKINESSSCLNLKASHSHNNVNSQITVRAENGEPSKEALYDITFYNCLLALAQ